MSWFYRNFYSKFSPTGGFVKVCPGRLDSYNTYIYLKGCAAKKHKELGIEDGITNKTTTKRTRRRRGKGYERGEE